MKKTDMREMRTIGYWSALGGVEVKNIDGNREQLWCVTAVWSGGGCNNCHKVKIQYNAKGEPYIRLFNQRFYLSDCIRTGY